jgi:hypothetical protein
MHGQFYQQLERPSDNKKKSLAWLCSSGLVGEMESLIIAAQYQALNMCYHQRNIMKQPVDSQYRMCQKAEEHIKHIIAGCIIIAPSEYSNRHNKGANYIPWAICKCMELQITDKYYEYMPERVINVNDTTVIWDILVIADQTILTN